LTGMAALVKSLVLVVGVPLAILRLWMLAPGPRAPIVSGAWAGNLAWSHAALAIVAVVWVVASSSLVRDLARALSGRLGTPAASWSTRWASRIAGLLLLASAGSVAAAGVVSASTRGEQSATRPAATAMHRPGTTGTRDATAGVVTHVPTYVVVPGDCLASIAARELGSADDWPALARLNMGRLQPDGLRMTDPSVILPGWVLALPGDPGDPARVARVARLGPLVVTPARAADPSRVVVPTARRTRATSAHVDAGGLHSGMHRLANGHAQLQGPVHAGHAQSQARGPARPVAPPRHLDELGVLGLGLLVAAGLARHLRVQRRARECLRGPGERAARPRPLTGTAAALVDPLADAELLDWVDTANRLLWRGCALLASETGVAGARSPGGVVCGPVLPQVRRVRAGGFGVEIELVEPVADVVDGFVAVDGGTTWALDTGAGLAELAALVEGCGRYVPALIPVGDDESVSYLVALGPGRRLSLDGQPAGGQAGGGTTLPTSELAGILVALGTLPWASEIQVEVVAGALGHESPVMPHLNTSSPGELAELARSTPDEQSERLSSTWTPQLLVVAAGEAAGGLDEELLESLGRSAGIVSLGGPATDRLVVRDDSLLLEPGGIVLRRASPSAAQVELIRALIDASSADPLPGRALGAARAARADIADHPHRERPAASAPAAPAPAAPAPPVAGPIEVRLLRRTAEVVGWAAEPPSKDRARAVELVAYLVLHGRRASGERIRSAVFSRGDRTASLGRVHNVCSAARSALGARPDGRSYLPAAVGGHYQLDPSVTSDWGRFEELRLLALAVEPPIAVDLLTEALSLVEGPPLAEALSGWDWMLAEGLLATIVSAIVDAAHHLATLALASRDLALARTAVATGRLAEPWSEILARDAMAVSELEGDLDGVRRTWHELEGALDRLDGNEPSAETRALYESLVGSFRSARNG
ncbi:MAG: hypothetical protein ACYCR4_01040, partial [Acidimicrobiales bacterium]